MKKKNSRGGLKPTKTYKTAALNPALIVGGAALATSVMFGKNSPFKKKSGGKAGKKAAKKSGGKKQTAIRRALSSYSKGSLGRIKKKK